MKRFTLLAVASALFVPAAHADQTLWTCQAICIGIESGAVTVVGEVEGTAPYRPIAYRDAKELCQYRSGTKRVALARDVHVRNRVQSTSDTESETVHATEVGVATGTAASSSHYEQTGFWSARQGGSSEYGAAFAYSRSTYDKKRNRHVYSSDSEQEFDYTPARAGDQGDFPTCVQEIYPDEWVPDYQGDEDVRA